MPFGDRTGPTGMGPRTGRGFGYCRGYNYPDYVLGPGFGRGFARGFGRGFGRGFNWRVGLGTEFGSFAGYGFHLPYGDSPEEEKDYLKNRISEMEKTIEILKKRMSEIDKKK